MTASGRHRGLLAAFAVLAALSFACSAGPPPRQIAEARLAIEDARNAGADRLASREYDAAVAHLNVAESSWERRKDAVVAARWARVAEGEARNAQYHAEAQTAEEALRRESERRSRAELAVRDAEIAVLQARARTDAEKRAAEAEARAERERREAQEELEKKKAELEETRRTADEAREAAEEQQKRLEEQQRADEARQAELESARQERERSEEELRNTLEQLAQVREEARGLVVTLPGNIYFDVNKSEVKPGMRDRLVEIGRALAAVPDRRVLIEGHTDSDGSDTYNLRLSELRAEAVRSVLVSGGVSPDRIEIHGYGKTRPVASNATATGKARNRRVEIVVQGAGATAPAP
jgi:outer membrane protein OmpA-like peptidoglycan-associated protein